MGMTLSSIHVFTTEPIIGADYFVSLSDSWQTYMPPELPEDLFEYRKFAKRISNITDAPVLWFYVFDDEAIWFEFYQKGKRISAYSAEELTGTKNLYGIPSLIGYEDVTKDASVVLAAPEGYHWLDETVLGAHNYVVTSVGATCTDVSYDLYECACGNSYKANFGSKKLPVVAKIGTTLYASWEEAMEAANEGDTIVLTKKINEGEAIVITKNVTVDLGGFIYTVSDDLDSGAAVVVAENVEATLTNGTLQIRYAARADFDALIANNGTLNVNNITLKAANAGGVVVKGNELVIGENVSAI